MVQRVAASLAGKLPYSIACTIYHPKVTWGSRVINTPPLSHHWKTIPQSWDVFLLHFPNHDSPFRCGPPPALSITRSFQSSLSTPRQGYVSFRTEPRWSSSILFIFDSACAALFAREKNIAVFLLDNDMMVVIAATALLMVQYIAGC